MIGSFHNNRFHSTYIAHVHDNGTEYNMRNEIYIKQTNENLAQPSIAHAAVGHDVIIWWLVRAELAFY